MVRSCASQLVASGTVDELELLAFEIAQCASFPPGAGGRVVDDGDLRSAADEHLLAIHGRAKLRELALKHYCPVDFAITLGTKKSLHRLVAIEDARQLAATVESEIERVEGADGR